MIKDPLSGWLGPDPYEELASVGVTPATTHEELLDASFALLRARKMNPGIRRALDELRMIDRRLFVDLLRYNVDLAAEIAAAQTLPAPEPDLGEIPEAAEALRVSESDLLRMVDSLSPLELPPPVPVTIIEDFVFPTASLLADVIRFDR